MWKLACSVVCAAALAGCGNSMQYPQAIQQQNSRSFVRDSGNIVHLYVSDAGAHAIFRFPMHAGIPAPQPDATISGFTLPRGIAIGPDNRLYAVDVGSKKVLIFAPSPDSDSSPVRTINVGHSTGVGTVSVDPSGDTYVNYTVTCTTEGFSCGYSDVYSSFADGSTFIKTLNFGGGPGGSIVRSMAFEPSGRLIEETGSQGPVVYSNVLKGGAQYSIFCGASNDAANVWGTGFNEVIETDLGNPTAPQIDVIPNFRSNSDTHCPKFYAITSSTVPLIHPIAMVTNGTYLYVANGKSDTLKSGIVLVFDPKVQGSQKPVAVLSGAASKLLNPVGIAIGP